MADRSGYKITDKFQIFKYKRKQKNNSKWTCKF